MTENTHTLGEIKDRIYKALDQFSVNGEKSLADGGAKADMELKMLSAINSGLSRISFSLPSISKALPVEFSRPEIITSKQAEKSGSTESSALSLEIPQGHKKLYLSARVCGSLTLCAFDGDENEVFCRDIETRLGLTVTENACIESQADIRRVSFGGSYYLQNLVIYSAKGCPSLSEEEIPPYGKTAICLPSDFGKVDSLYLGEKRLDKENYEICGGCLFTNDITDGFGRLEYTPRVQNFSESSCEEDTIDLPEIAVCALVYLAASELCPIGDGELYARLISKYQDIALNCRRDDMDKVCRNSFYRAKRRRFG